MAFPRRTLLIVLGSIVVLTLLVAISIPLFLNADAFRTRIETALTTSLGRKVTLGKLDLSVLTGNLVAENATIADDPAFSTQPFLQATKVKIGIEMIPLILSREIHVTGFAIDSPKINLLRAANGTWNYSTIGRAQQNTAANKESSTLIPNLTVGRVTISNGQMTVGATPAPGAPASPSRTYDQLALDAKDFSFQKSFPFTASAHLPGDGTVSLKGNAGPINPHDASLTPFGIHLEAKHIDPLAAGFVDSTSGISGTIEAIDTQATWNGQQLHVLNLVVDTPKLTFVRENKPTVATPPPAPNSNNMLSTFTADHLQIKSGTITIKSPGQATPSVYQQLNAELTNVSPTAASPFKLTAQVPGGGGLTADGTAGPINQANASATPLNAHVAISHLDLASSGVISPEAGIAGIANVDLKALSDGKNLNANVSANIQGLRIAKNGSPSPKPVLVQLTLVQNLQALSGQLQNAAITIGKAVINAAGTYQTTGPTTALNLRVTTQGTSIDELEAFLPSVGVHLPSGSRLQGGTLTTNLNVTGSAAAPIISGPIRIDNTNLAGFDLGSKLGPLSSLAGIKSGSGTAIQSLSTNVTINGGNVRTDNVSVVVPAIGSATGAGTISAAGALNYNVILKLTGVVGAVSGISGKGGGASGAAGIAGQLMGMIPAGTAGGAAGSVIGNYAGAALRNGVPVTIGGTTSNPTFTPNMGGIVNSATSGATTKGATKPSSGTDPLSNALGGLFKPH
ncbi:MAG TPA: AsmA family protein [Edaphobacter sp.]|nr:AsmA family protein [Edaphobacter sp.]